MGTHQADQMIDLLAAMLEELRGLRSDFMEFTGYNSTKASDMVEAITGPLGYHLGDLHTKLNELESAVGLVELAVAST